jgi:phenylalanyl-tRNA synthetase beta chain
MRPSMLQTGLEAIAHNLNRKNNDLRFFEFGKTYSTQGPGKYSEQEHVSLYITGQVQEDAWKGKGTASDIFYLKGVVARILQLTGISKATFASVTAENNLVNTLQVTINKDVIATLGQVTAQELKRFDIKQPVFYADLDFELMLKYISANSIKAKELPRQLPVRRDLAMVVPKSLPFADVENTVKKVKLDKLQSIQLFDIFESEKLGADKKSLAVSFTFLDEEKTPTDKDIDGMMNKIMNALETNLQAEIRK